VSLRRSFLVSWAFFTDTRACRAPSATKFAPLPFCRPLLSGVLKKFVPCGAFVRLPTRPAIDANRFLASSFYPLPLFPSGLSPLQIGRLYSIFFPSYVLLFSSFPLSPVRPANVPEQSAFSVSKAVLFLDGWAEWGHSPPSRTFLSSRKVTEVPRPFIPMFFFFRSPFFSRPEYVSVTFVL